MKDANHRFNLIVIWFLVVTITDHCAAYDIIFEF